MPYRMLVVDLDGTVIPWDAPLGTRDAEAARRLAEIGVHVTIATGRIYSGAIDAARRLGVRGSIACVNGSHVADVDTGESRQAHVLAGSALESVEAAVVDGRLAPVLLSAEHVHHGPRIADIEPFVRRWSERMQAHAGRISAWDDPDVFAAMAFGPDAEVRSAADRIEADHGGEVVVDRFTLFDSGLSGLKARVAGHSKGTALALLAEERGVRVEETIAVGDWHNDVPMLEAAGLSFVMAQAEDEVARHADRRLVSDGRTGGAIAEIAAEVFGLR